MNTREFLISSTGAGMDDALSATEQLGYDSGLTAKENLRLRLLSEELLGMLRSIAGKVEATYHVEELDGHFKIHLTSKIEMNQEVRKQLISVSSQGKNAAVKGFMDKIKDMIAVALLPDEYGISIVTGFALDIVNASPNNSPTAHQVSAETLMWSMHKYKSELNKMGDDSDEEWDELEKSIVASIADEVIVRIVGSNVEIEIQKAF